MRLTDRSSVLLPQPDGPISAVTLPLGRVMLTSKRACFSPYQRLKSSTSRIDSSFWSSGWISAGTISPAAMAVRRSMVWVVLVLIHGRFLHCKSF